ncbi:MAG: DUF4062 domain-containing protein [Chthoniobacteraceae bacterium]|nr:DUF4062 domain-containing protein [Chthoniobacteraceae bacterium]
MNELQSREMRVFLSSTFRDMEAERAHLIKNVFPRVRTACRSRQVGFTEIDLRWGVTEEDANNGATVEICLREIDNCRNFPPFFIGFLGERYGWIPQEKELISYWDHNVLSPYAQVIKDAVSRGISVTELEMELAVFGSESTPPAYTPTQVREDRALFLFRDETLSEQFFARAATTSPGVVHVPDFFDSGGGKLELLKNKIRRSGLLKGENYTSLEMLGQIIEEHLIGALDRYFPTGEVPSEEEFIESAHRVFRRHRLVDFVPRPDLRAAIVDGISKRVDFPNLGPLLVTGRPGHGKSACMADVAQAVETGEIAACHRWKIIDHYVGADGSDTLDAWIYSTLCRWKILIGDESLILPETPKGRQEAFIPWAARAACSSRG